MISESGLLAFWRRSVWRQWKLWGAAAVIVVALASSVYAYWAINAPGSPTLYVTATSPPLELRMELDKAAFARNETVAIHLALKNIGAETITIFAPFIDGFVGFIVKDGNGTVVLDYPSGGFAAVDEATLEPGDQLRKTFDWTQFGHYPGESSGVIREAVPPGTYQILGRTDRALSYSSEVGDWVDITTPAITITIG